MNAAELNSFGTRYTASWFSQCAASVAAFYSDEGSLKINDGPPSVGRTAIAAAAQVPRQPRNRLFPLFERAIPVPLSRVNRYG